MVVNGAYMNQNIILFDWPVKPERVDAETFFSNPLWREAQGHGEGLGLLAFAILHKHHRNSPQHHAHASEDDDVNRFVIEYIF